MNGFDYQNGLGVGPKLEKLNGLVHFHRLKRSCFPSKKSHLFLEIKVRPSKPELPFFSKINETISLQHRKWTHAKNHEWPGFFFYFNQRDFVMNHLHIDSNLNRKLFQNGPGIDLTNILVRIKWG